MTAQVPNLHLLLARRAIDLDPESDDDIAVFVRDVGNAMKVISPADQAALVVSLAWICKTFASVMEPALRERILTDLEQSGQ